MRAAAKKLKLVLARRRIGRLVPRVGLPDGFPADAARLRRKAGAAASRVARRLRDFSNGAGSSHHHHRRLLSRYVWQYTHWGRGLLGGGRGGRRGGRRHHGAHHWLGCLLSLLRVLLQLAWLIAAPAAALALAGTRRRLWLGVLLVLERGAGTARLPDGFLRQWQRSGACRTVLQTDVCQRRE